MSDFARERPCIYVSLLGEAPADLYGWVEVGAEEEGLPTQQVAPAERDVVAAAYAAAQSSRFAVGVGVAADRVVLHEAHMPPAQPVLSIGVAGDARRACRLIGGNAARMVVRLPLRLGEEAEAPQVAPRQAGPSAEAGEAPAYAWGEGEVRQIARIIARLLNERGIR